MLGPDAWRATSMDHSKVLHEVASRSKSATTSSITQKSPVNIPYSLGTGQQTVQLNWATQVPICTWLSWSWTCVQKTYQSQVALRKRRILKSRSKESGPIYLPGRQFNKSATKCLMTRRADDHYCWCVTWQAHDEPHVLSTKAHGHTIFKKYIQKHN